MDPRPRHPRPTSGLNRRDVLRTGLVGAPPSPPAASLGRKPAGPRPSPDGAAFFACVATIRLTSTPI